MKTLEEAKQKVAQEDGYRYFDDIADHLKEEYLSRAYELRMYEVAKSAHWKGCMSNDDGVSYWQTKSFEDWYNKEVRGIKN